MKNGEVGMNNKEMSDLKEYLERLKLETKELSKARELQQTQYKETLRNLYKVLCSKGDERLMDYDEILNIWHDKVVEKAEKLLKEADNCELGSKEYYKYRGYADGLYIALSMLALEERKAKRKLNNK